MEDLKACISDVQGFDTIVTVNINMFDSAAFYDPTNQFQIQVLSSMTFGIINTGVLGTVVSNTDTTIQLSIPIIPLLGSVGLQPGMVYLRIISTASSTPWNQFGTLVRLTIGAPNPSPISAVAYNPTNFTGYFGNVDSTICLGQAMYFFINPYNSQSTYKWTLNTDNNWSTAPSMGILFNSLGNFYVSVIETNNGCVGPGSDTAIIHSIGPPSVAISGPNQICVGDTGSFSVPLQPNSYYHWSSNIGTIIDTLNNDINLSFGTSGTAQVIIQALNACGTSNSQKVVTVRPSPNINAGADTTVCPGETLTFSTPPGTNYFYLWKDTSQTLSTVNSVTITPETDLQLYLRVTTYPNLNGGCKSYDTLNINLRDKGPVTASDTLICEGTPLTIQAVTPGSSYNWNTGQTSAAVNIFTQGTYYVTSYSANRCAAVDSFYVTTKYCEEPKVDSLFIPNVFTPNGDGNNNNFEVIHSNIEKFEAVIYDRWGLIVGKLNAATEVWDGRHFKTGNACTDGVYYYIITYNFVGKQTDQRSGFITLLR
jgi:gliding motility-associated-like protein